MKYIKLNGIVLKETDFEDTSKILTLLTDKKGKIQVISKNCKRTHNSLIGVSQPLIYSEFILKKSNDIYLIVSASIIESFFEISKSLDQTIYASYFIELIDNFLDFEQEDENYLRLLLNTLFLLKNNFDKEVLARIFEIKVLSISGFLPNLIYCNKCGRTDIDEVFFSFEEGCIYCSSCKKKHNTSITLDTIKTILLINATELKKIHKIEIPNHVNKQLSSIISKYISIILQKEIHILDFLKFIK